MPTAFHAAQVLAAAHSDDVELRQQLETLPQAAYLCDAQGRITYYNARAAELWGQEPRLNDPKWLYCGSLRMFSLAGDPIAHHQCWMARALLEEQKYIGLPIVVERPDGGRLTTLAHANPLHDAEGHLIGGINVLVEADVHQEADSLSPTSEAALLRCHDAYEEQQRRHAMELHDNAIKNATAALLYLDTYSASLPELPRLLERARRCMAESLEQNRRLMNRLRPPVLDEAGLGPAIAELAHGEYGDQLHVEFDCPLKPGRFSPRLESSLYRIAAELIGNVRRHSHCKRARVTLEPDVDQVRLEVQDWGVGFDPEESLARHGGLQECTLRANLVGGQMHINSAPDDGTLIVVEIPV